MSRALKAPAGGTLGPAQLQLGSRLRAIRQERGLSLAKVSKATGISTSFLHLLEKGRSDVSVGRLLELISFFDVGLDEVMAHSVKKGDVGVVPAGSYCSELTLADGVALRLLASGEGREMTPVMSIHGPRSSVELGEHSGQSFIHMLEGRLLFERGSNEAFVLGPGDSAYTQGDLTRVTNPTDTIARAIGVVSGPRARRAKQDASP